MIINSFQLGLTYSYRCMKLQRSLSRKGSQRVVEKKIGLIATSNDRDNVVATCSPRGTISFAYTKLQTHHYYSRD